MWAVVPALSHGAHFSQRSIIVWTKRRRDSRTRASFSADLVQWLHIQFVKRLKQFLRGVTALTRAVSGEKQIYSGNLEILPGIGKPGKFFGKYEIFSGHWAKIWYYMLSNNIYTVICTQCMRCTLCILTLENGWTSHDTKWPISNISN